MKILIQIGGLLLFIVMLPYYFYVWVWYDKQEKKRTAGPRHP